MVPAWFLLWCEEDTSLSLVEKECVIYDGNVEVGETVKFFFNGQECIGVVRALDDDHAKLKKLQDKLNALNKSRPASFHEGERKAKKKSKENIKTIVSMLKSKPSKDQAASASSSMKSQEKILPKYQQQQSEDFNPKQTLSESDADTDHEIILSNSDMELTQEEELLFKKLAKKRYKVESKKDQQIMKRKRNEDRSVADKPDSVPSCPDTAGSEDEKQDAHGDEEKKDAQGGDSSSDESPKRPVRTGRKSRKFIKAIPFEGNMFLFDEYDGTDEDKQESFVELLGPKDSKTGIYCTKEGWRKARVYSKAAGAYARKLMEGVFTPAALLECTVSGDLYKAGGRKNMKRSPKLDQNGVSAIVEAASVRQAKKKWSSVQDAQSIKSAMRQKLVEIRSAHKKHLARNAAGDSQ